MEPTFTEQDLDDFVRDCYLTYAIKGIELNDPSYEWHSAHHPHPACLGGTVTVPLLREDHAVHGVIQSEVFQHPCIFNWEKQYLTGPYLDLFSKWKTVSGQIGGAMAGGRGGRRNVEEGLGWWRQTEEEWAETCRKGGETTGTKAVENKTGIHIDDPAKRSEWAALGGAQCKGKVYWNDGTKNKRSETCPGEGWVRGIITNRWKNK